MKKASAIFLILLSTSTAGCGDVSPWAWLSMRDAGPVHDTERGDSSSPPEVDASDDGVRPLMPHAVGNWWTFLYTHLEDADFGACAAGEWTAGIFDSRTEGGTTTYTYLSACSKDGYRAEAEMQFEGDKSVVINFGAPFIMTDVPVADGHTWTVDFSSGPKTYRWEDAGAVTVPAGTFDSCWDRVDDINDDHLIYCRGVGRVMGITRNEYKSELVDFFVQDE